MGTTHTFVAVDYVIFAITIAISLGIGVYYALSGGRQKTTSEFLVGNRRMQVLPVAISLMVSFESSIMMLGIPAEIYEYGIQWVWQMVGYLASNLFAIKVMVPLLHPLKITSAYEYLELRFNSHAVRLIGTVLGMMSYTCYIGIVLFGPAVALEAVTGFPQFVSIVLVALAAVIYTSLGGIKAVIWTDVFQASIMYAGMIAILIKGTMAVGGVKETWRIANENGRVNLFNFDPDPRIRHTFWNLLVGALIRGFGLIFNQSTIQRMSATPTVADAKKVMYITAPAFAFALWFAAIEGVVMYAYYHTVSCDPLASGKIHNPNQLIPFMVMDIFHTLPGMPGLFLASLCCASLSTLSSGLSSMSALFFTDLVKPHTKPMSQLKSTIIAKLSVVFFGCLAVAVAFLVSYVGGNLMQIAGTMLSAFGGPLSGLFLLGCFVPFANAKGAIISTICSITFTAWLATGQYYTKVYKRWPKLPSAPVDKCFAKVNETLESMSNYTTFSTYMTSPSSSYMSDGGSTWNYDTTISGTTDLPPVEGINNMYTISYLWLGVIGILTVFFGGSFFSLCTGRVKPEDANPIYLVSLADTLLWYLPESVRKPLRFGVDYSRAKQFHAEADKLDEYVLKTEKEGIEIILHADDDVVQENIANGDPHQLSVDEYTPLSPKDEPLYDNESGCLDVEEDKPEQEVVQVDISTGNGNEYETVLQTEEKTEEDDTKTVSDSVV